MTILTKVNTSGYRFSLIGDEYTRRDGTPGGGRVCRRLITPQEWVEMQAGPSEESARVLAATAALRRLERPDLSDPIIDRALRTPKGRNMRALLEGRDNPDDLVSLRRLVKRQLPASVPALALPDGGALASPDPFFLSGLCTTDIDAFDGPNAAAEREDVWQQIVECPYIPAAGGSASGENYWAVVAIPQATSIREYKIFYWGALHRIPFLRMHQDTGQDNPNRERYQGTGRIHVRDTVVVLHREELLEAYADSAHAKTHGYKRETVNKQSRQESANREAPPDGWWERAVHDMRTKEHGNRHLGIYLCGVAVRIHGGDYDTYLEQMIDAAGDAGLTDAADVERQFSNGFKSRPQEEASGGPTGAAAGAPGDVKSPGEGPRVSRSDTGLLAAFDAMGVGIRKNLRSRDVEIWLPQDQEWAEGLPDRGRWAPTSEDIESRLICEINRKFNIMFGAGTWSRSVQSLLASRQVDPLWSYVYGGKWDGRPRLETALQDVLGVEDTPLARWALQSVLIAAIDRMHVPGADHHTTVVLASIEGGYGKSAFWKQLCPKGLFIDVRDLSVPFQDLNERISKAAVVEFSELAGLTGRNLKIIKALLTSDDDSMRWAYGRSTVHMMRRWVGVGSCNIDAAGSLPEDTSGHRRWLVLEVPRLVGFKRIERWAGENRDHLWYEARDLYLSTPESDRTALHHVPTSLRAAQFKNNEQYEERHEGMRNAALSLTQTVCRPQKLVDLMLMAEIHVPRAAPDTVSLEDREAEARAAATRDKAGQGGLARELQRLGWSKRDTSVDGEKAIWWFPPTDLSGSRDQD